MSNPEQLIIDSGIAASGADCEDVYFELVSNARRLLGANAGFIAIDNNGTGRDYDVLTLRDNGSADRHHTVAPRSNLPPEVLAGNSLLGPVPATLSFLGSSARNTAEMYLAAVPINGKNAIGAIGVVFKDRLPDNLPLTDVLAIFAARAASEARRVRDRSSVENEELYRLMFNESLDGHALIDEHGIVVDVNPAVGKLDGFSREEIIGYLPPAFRDPATHPAYRKLVSSVLAGETLEATNELPHKNGGTCVAETRSVRIDYRGRPHMLVIMRDLSEQRRSETELVRSEQLYRAMFDASLDGLVVLDADGNVVDVNTSLTRLDGYSKADLLGKYPPTFRDSSMHEIHQRYIRDVLESGSLQTEGRLLRKDGTRYTAEMRSVTIDFLGQPHILVVVRDISDRRAQELELTRREDQYRTVFEGMVDGLVLVDQNGIVIDLNQAMIDLDYWDREDIINHMPPNYVGDDAAIAQHQEYIRRILNDEPVKTEFIFRRRDRSTYVAEVRGIRIEHNNAPHVLLIIRDISLQRAHDAALARSENRLSATVDTALDCIIAMDEEGNIIDFNPAAEECFGYRRLDVLGLPLDEVVIPPQHRHAHRKGLKTYLETGEGPYLGTRIEVEAMRKDGSLIDAELAINVAEGTGGKIFIGYLRDITEQKKAAEQSEILEAQLRQAQKMEAIGHLTGGVAHDFNNILTSILGYVTLARERVDDLGEEKLVRYLDRAERAGERARDLIAQMLTFSRGQQGEKREVNVIPVIRESLALMESSLPASIEMTADLPNAIPTITIDPVQFEQIVVNLCINARDAMDGIGSIDVRLRTVSPTDIVCAGCREPIVGSFIELSVTDSGPGIDPNIVERIFEPFFTTKDIGKGTGMGLSTVHGIVHDHNGHTIVESAIGHGTSMQVLFPVGDETLNIDVASESAARQIHAPSLGGRVLIIDDNVDVSDYLEDLLDSWGLAVTVSNDSSAAKTLITAQPQSFDLIITDQTMPKVTGLEIAQHVAAITSDLPVILYTGYSEVVTEETAREAGIRAFLKKPLDTGELRNLLQEILD